MTSPISKLPFPGDVFHTTRWTMVLAAGRPGGRVADEAFAELCGAYWFPLYAYVRRCGHGKEDAEDLTQSFFAGLLLRRDFDVLDAGNGRFRAYLLAAMKHFLANERDRRNRLKRGGGTVHFPLDWQNADSRFQIADLSALTPDAAFDREWALELLGRVIPRLREEFVAEGKGERFESLKVFLTLGKGEISYAEPAAELEMSDSALRVAVHRLRKRYRELLREEVAQTLSDASMVAEELAVLLGAFTPRRG